MAGCISRLLSGAAFLLSAPAALARDFNPADWSAEAEATSRLRIQGHRIKIDTPKGFTLWYRPKLASPIRIRFEARMVAKGGPNDSVSDLNAFWMASDANGGNPIGQRDGKFEAYDTLQTYYVGIGGNRNSTTRLRRYIAKPGERPLLPQHDRKDALLIPNRWTQITLTADGQTITVDRDGNRLFTLDDPAPYTAGWFGLRTTWSHLLIRRLTITPIKAQP
ncbi:Tat pathway signal sequence domain protein [Novosphingobium umbonatum]|uniref:Tat pathway signal sequence domain protein n=1 Tax=Novosphingobium umbonatum TaxID=1908524 RepID=A0A3S2UQP5_9SPHN|nr:DUF6250 domain-containing protein [Novosphingobium umbonatum]RVU04498.1 Tat pathway signal sequence domain protein [Novosphingobium umbonatum]